METIRTNLLRNTPCPTSSGLRTCFRSLLKCVDVSFKSIPCVLIRPLRHSRLSPRFFLYGYRVGEVNLPVLDGIDSTVFCLTSEFRNNDPSRRPPMLVSVFDPPPAIPPRPDTTCPVNLFSGVCKRMCSPKLPYNRRTRKRFRKFVGEWCGANLTPLDPSTDFSVDTWLTKTHYTEARKTELRNVYSETSSIPLEQDDSNGISLRARVKIFVKDEFYESYKYPRGIWSRDDSFKVIAGPVFKAIEEEVFKLPYFIKKIPMADRPAYLHDLIHREGFIYVSTDYTSFERHFSSELQLDCEWIMYQHMLKLCPHILDTLAYLARVILGYSHVTNKFMLFLIACRRFSGEMSTSLGNGWSNLMFFLFAMKENKIQFTGPGIEGDDGLAGIDKRIPQSFWSKMGLNIKIEEHERLTEASFCGNIFDEVELINITEPLYYVSSLLWSSRQYALSKPAVQLSLLKCKALSLAWQYPGCPILSTVALRILDLLTGVTPDVNALTNEYEREQYHLNVISKPVPTKQCGLRTRALMASKFGISIENQLFLERFLSKMDLFGTNWNQILHFFPFVWQQNFQNYARKCSDFETYCHQPEFFKAPGTELDSFLTRNPTLTKLSSKQFYKEMQAKTGNQTQKAFLKQNKKRFDSLGLTKQQRIARYNASQARKKNLGRAVASMRNPPKPKPSRPPPTRAKFSECLVRYAQASIDPWHPNLAEVCIPDTTVIPSNKYAVTINGTLVIGTQGVGYASLNPWTAAINDNIDGNPGAQRIPLVCTTATYDSADYILDPVLYTGNRITTHQSNSMYNNASFGNSPMRLVAAGIEISYIGVLLNQAGIVSLLQSDGLTPFPKVVPVDTVNKNPRTRICSVSAKDRCYLSYNPTNDDVTSYKPLTNYVTPVYANSAGMSAPLLIGVSGATPGTSFFVKVKCYYECQIPGMNVTPSHGDPVGYGALQAARSTVQTTNNPQHDFSSIMQEAGRNLLTQVSGALPAAGAAFGAYFGNPQLGSALGEAGRSIVVSALTPTPRTF